MTATVRVRISVEALSPLNFGARRGTTGNIVNTLDYVPGTALRGAVAARYLQEFGDASEPRFQDVFVKGGVLFANLYPVSDPDLVIPSVFPATAYACKAHKEKHGVSDILMRAAPFHLAEGRVESRLIDDITECRKCGNGQPAHRLKGFYERQALGSPDYNVVDVHKRHVAHVGINRQRQTAEKGFLYGRQVINEARREESGGFIPQTFCGELIVSEAHLDFVTAELLTKEVVLRIGESRTRGLGKVRVRRSEPVETDSESVIRNRLTEFNRRFCEHSGRSIDGGYVVLTLQSEAILTDAFMRPKLSIDTEDVLRAVSADPNANQITADTFRLVYANAGTRLVQSWNTASGYPKPDDLATKMGSVFLFEISEELWGVSSAQANTETDTLTRLLGQLQQNGVGKRRSEGFGRLTICDSFHWEVDELWQAT
jgi:CRISPR-associated protein Csx10